MLHTLLSTFELVVNFYYNTFTPRAARQEKGSMTGQTKMSWKQLACATSTKLILISKFLAGIEILIAYVISNSCHILALFQQLNSIILIAKYLSLAC